MKDGFCKRKMKRILAFILSLVLVLTSVNITAFAKEEDNTFQE